MTKDTIEMSKMIHYLGTEGSLSIGVYNPKTQQTLVDQSTHINRESFLMSEKGNTPISRLRNAPG
jgi:hypothetical protein